MLRWSEYTLYRLALDARGLFHHLHTSIPTTLDSTDASGSHHAETSACQEGVCYASDGGRYERQLICPSSKWFKDGVDWDPASAFAPPDAASGKRFNRKSMYGGRASSD